MAQYEGDIAGVPVDGWTQMIVYRKDLFDANGLDAPTSYENIEKAVDALHNPPEMYGFVAATKVDENFMSQVLEHVFLANGVSPVDENGFKPLDEKATIEVLDFYKAIAEASPAGELYWQQSRELYFAGKTAMIIWSPFILDELAGLRDRAADDHRRPDGARAGQQDGRRDHLRRPQQSEWCRLGGHPLFRHHQRRRHRPGHRVRQVLRGRRLSQHAVDRAGGQVPGAPRHAGRADQVRRTAGPSCRSASTARRPCRSSIPRRRSTKSSPAWKPPTAGV